MALCECVSLRYVSIRHVGKEVRREWRERRDRKKEKEKRKRKKERKKEEWGQKGWASSSNIRQSDSALKLFIMGGEHFTL